MNEQYLGDAVYVAFDGEYIVLRTGDGNAQVIYLEPGVVNRLLEYIEEIRS